MGLEVGVEAFEVVGEDGGVAWDWRMDEILWMAWSMLEVMV